MTDGRTRDLKVKVPLHHYVQLHNLKILDGKTLAASLCEALDLYFEDPDNSPETKDALERLRP